MDRWGLIAKERGGVGGQKITKRRYQGYANLTGLLLKMGRRLRQPLGAVQGKGPEKVSRVGDSCQTDLAGFLLKLDLTGSCTDGPRRRSRSLAGAWSGKESLSPGGRGAWEIAGSTCTDRVFTVCRGFPHVREGLLFPLPQEELRVCQRQG